MTRNFAPTPPDNVEIAMLIESQLGVLPANISTLRSGAWSSAVRIDTPTGSYVLRFSATPDDFRHDETASRFRSASLPIPRVHSIGNLKSQWWCVSDFVEGVHLDELDASDMHLSLPSLAGTLKTMRSIDDPATSGYGGWDAHGNGIFADFADQLLDVAMDGLHARDGGWSAVVADHQYESSVFTRGMTLLENLVQSLSAQRHLIHQDTINYNIRVRESRISGVFDWGCAMWGDPVYDLAWFRFWMPWYPKWKALDIPARLQDLVGIDGNHADKHMQCCLLHIGLMHIRYNTFINNLSAMSDVARATERLMDESQ